MFDRRKFLTLAAGLTGAAVMARPLGALATTMVDDRLPKTKGAFETLNLTDAEWKKKLTPAQYDVLRKAGTERPGSSALLKEKRRGVFACAGCELPLFKSEFKYESGTGWPSFFDVITGHIQTRADHSLFSVRTEYHCARCGGHHGHVFEDGPKPTGLRYCNNGVALIFIPDKAA